MLLRDRDDANVFYEEFEYLLPLYVNNLIMVCLVNVGKNMIRFIAIVVCEWESMWFFKERRKNAV